jgi:hypothetical protein
MLRKQKEFDSWIIRRCEEPATKQSRTNSQWPRNHTEKPTIVIPLLDRGIQKNQ